MPFELQTDAGGSTLKLSGRLGVQQARPLWDSLQGASALSQTLVLEAGAIEEIDTSIVQILCRVVHQGMQLRIGSASDGFMLSFELRGMARFFPKSQTTSCLPEQTVPTGLDTANERSVKRRSRQITRTASKGRVPRG